MAQKNTIDLDVVLDSKKDILNISQKIVYHNTSSQELNEIYFHNWPNSFSSNKSPLNQRLLDDFKKDFHFAKDHDKGFTKIETIKVNNQKVTFENTEIDILKINLSQNLHPKDSVIISANYQVKIPNGKYTKYGKIKNGYHLRYWYLVPAVFTNNKWQTLHNLNLDDLFQEVANYNISLKTDKHFKISSNLKVSQQNNNTYDLVGNQKKDIILNLSIEDKFQSFQTDSLTIITDIFKDRINNTITTEILQKEIDFIQEFLGDYPHKELLLDGNSVNKNSLKELYGLPSWMKAYPKNFKYELQLLQGLTIKFIDDSFLFNKREDLWLSDGLQTYLMVEYLKKHYPELSLWGRYSKIWGFRTYKLSQIKQYDKYAIIHQLRARKLLNQALITRADSLSNANKKLVNKFKAGIALEYLKDFISGDTVNKTIQNFYTSKKLKTTSSKDFETLLKKATNKNIDWFFEDFLYTDKSIDYKIKSVEKTANNDSLEITIKNLKETPYPISFYTINDKNVLSKKWLTGIDSIKKITIKNSDAIDIVGLNYEQSYPEFNSLDNYKKTNNSLIKKPLKFKFSKDFEDPFYTQIFFEPRVKYNLYDGVVLQLNFNNKHFIKHNFQYSLSPGYAFGSKEISGKFSFDYDIFYENSKLLYKTAHGFGGSSFNYDEDLRYRSFSPYTRIFFRRNNLRNLANSSILAKLNYIDREVLPGLQENSEEDNYSIFSLKYSYFNPTILRDTRFVFGTELAQNFSKLIADFRYIHFFSRRRSFDIRLYGGLFLSNNTQSDFFDFNLNRGSDYLFEQKLLGRSEDTGFFSQQYVFTDGGFKSFFNQNTQSNSQIYTANTSVGVWNWLEVYNDFGFLKNKNEKGRFFYENGLRLNFVTDFFEIYLPIYTNEGLEFNSGNYASKIRFTITTKLNKIYNFFRRDFL